MQVRLSADTRNCPLATTSWAATATTYMTESSTALVSCADRVPKCNAGPKLAAAISSRWYGALRAALWRSASANSGHDHSCTSSAATCGTHGPSPHTSGTMRWVRGAFVGRYRAPGDWVNSCGCSSALAAVPFVGHRVFSARHMRGRGHGRSDSERESEKRSEGTGRCPPTTLGCIALSAEHPKLESIALARPEFPTNPLFHGEVASGVSLDR